ncbi:MAG: GreA/GreB family elongation factor [Mycobacterium sp.]
MTRRSERRAAAQPGILTYGRTSHDITANRLAWITIAPGEAAHSDTVYADNHSDTAPWILHARAVLLKAAEEYGAVIGDRYLRDLIEHSAGIAGMPPTNTLVSAVADHCLALNEPILPALCALPDGRVHLGYAAWIHDSLGIAFAESELHADRERQRCYAHFGADVPPTRRTLVDIGGRLCEQAGIGAGSQRRVSLQRQAELDARQELILSGQAVPGAWVTVAFNGDPGDTDVYQLVLPADAKAQGDTCSVDCPLGKALLAAHIGETRRYSTESGRSMTITVLAVDTMNPKETAGR